MVILGIEGVGAATGAEGGKTDPGDGWGSMYEFTSLWSSGGGTAKATVDIMGETCKNHHIVRSQPF